MSAFVVFSPDVQRLATFYEVVLGARPLRESSGDIRVVSDRDEVLVHSIPRTAARDLEISTPPAPRDNAPIKPVFEVDSLAVALDGVRETGGLVTDRTFRLEGLVRHDVLDPDGNVVQLRSRTG
jgi:catechol 2,3-dioxygenase-like lactoylglutathione lyase family enzyme